VSVTHFYNSYYLILICLSNADCTRDGRGPAGRIVDRSLNAHLFVAKPMMKALGINNIYLATDNVTLRDIAPNYYPEYKWYHLPRKLRLYNTKKKLA
jgi:hypothetical protein